jgi:pyruvate dehydrogenase E2 component (dihydrolipoyllysine-residue acetyltransferase)
MPSLGADMEAGTLVEWRVQPGSRVHRGDVVALVETEKGIIDIESFEEGVIKVLSVQPGTRVPVGTPLALFEGEPAAKTIGDARVVAEAAPPLPTAPPAPAVPVSVGAEPSARSAPVTKPTVGRARRVSPAARARAAAAGVDLAAVQGTGPQGVITLQDVERAAATTSRGGAPPTSAGRAGIRNAIAASMSRAKREIPHYYLQLAMDFHAAASWLEAFNQTRPVPERVLTSVLLIKAAARAAAEKPGFNGYFGPAGFEPATSVHLGVAIALRGGGLVAPAILDANQKPITTIMRELQDLVGRVRAGHMRSTEIGSATLTVTSLGDEGADAVYPIIYPPQVAIVGFGSVLERPWVVEGRVEARPVLNLTLAADHRVTDGRQGAQFLARIRDWLSRPGDL